MKPIDKIVKEVCIPYLDEEPKRRTWYKYNAKVGTTCGTVIWANKDTIELGDVIYFGDIANFDLEDKKKWNKYPSDNVLRKGEVDYINDEPRAFIKLV